MCMCKEAKYTLKKVKKIWNRQYCSIVIEQRKNTANKHFSNISKNKIATIQFSLKCQNPRASVSSSLGCALLVKSGKATLITYLSMKTSHYLHPYPTWVNPMLEPISWMVQPLFTRWSQEAVWHSRTMPGKYESHNVSHSCLSIW